MNQDSIYSKPNLKLSYSDANALKENTDNDSKNQIEDQNGLNQQNLGNLQQSIEDIQARINILKKQKESEKKQHQINLQYKDNEILIYKEMIGKVQQQYNDCQQQNTQTIKQLNSQIINTQNEIQLTEQKILSNNNQMVPCEILKIPLLFDYNLYKGLVYKLDEQRYHHDCNRKDNTISIGDDGKIYCDADCGAIDCHVSFLNFNEKKIFTSYQENIQTQCYKLDVIFQNVLNQSLKKHDHQTRIRFIKINK